MLKSIITDMESVPEAARQFYAETEDGRFILEVEPVEGLALQTVDGLKSALASERGGHREAVAALRAAEARIAAFGDLDPAAARDALARVAAGPTTDVEAAVEARVAALRSSIADAAGTETRAARSELETVKATLARREDQLQRATRDNVIRAELERVRPLDDASDALLLMAHQHIRMVEEEGELVARVVDKKGEVRTDAKGRPMSVRAFMGELRDQRPGLFKAPDVKGMNITTAHAEAGAGASGHGGADNPFSRSGWNVTQQVVMTARNPSLAARLKAQA